MPDVQQSSSVIERDAGHERLGCVLAGLGLTLAELQRSAEQIVLFGSRAAGLGRTHSDWDLLVIGEGRSRHTPAIDLVWVTPRELGTPKWLASELAGHIARWGRWIHGAPDWVAEAGCGEPAREHKARRLASRLAALEQAWNLLPPACQREHEKLVRRDLQRHALLAQGDAVPPSRVLDDAWQTCADPVAELLYLARCAGVCTAFFETVIITLYLNRVHAEDASAFRSSADAWRR